MSESQPPNCLSFIASARRRAGFGLKLFVFILAGAIINVAVAWGCALWSTGRYTEEHLQRGDSADLDSNNRRNGIKVRLYPGSWTWAQANVLGAHWREMVRNADGKPADSSLQFLAGLPMRTVYCTGKVSLLPTINRSGQLTSAVEWDGGLHTPKFLAPQFTPHFVLPRVAKPLPYLLLPSGFAINTIFYAAIVWMLVAVPGYIRRRRRIKRGLCVKCAYPVGVTSAVCSECGTPVHPRNALHGAAAPCNPR